MAVDARRQGSVVRKRARDEPAIHAALQHPVVSILDGEMMAAALIDRLVHHCHIVNIQGISYRMQDHQKLQQSGPARRRKKDGP